MNKQELEKLGYSFKISANGYDVKYDGRCIAAASVLLPREKPLHWRHAKQNMIDFLEQAICSARNHHSMTKEMEEKK